MRRRVASPLGGVPPIRIGAALNGSRPIGEHLAVPRTPDAIARAARAAQEAGADVVHVHAFDHTGNETLAPESCGAVVRAIRATCGAVSISLTTSAEIEPDPVRRYELVSAWTELPDLVSANQGEPGIVELCEHLLERGVGIEAGLLKLSDAEAFVRSGLVDRCIRVLLEPLDLDPEEATRHAEAMERVLADAGVMLEQMHHGDGIASWAVCRRAITRGHGIRTGLEDTVVLPSGDRASDNADLVRAAVEMMNRG